MYKKVSQNISQEGKTLFRVRFTRKRKTTTKFFKSKSDALAFRKKKLGF